tara:strand:+ start:167 stop:445 length:279 start_codon:yes stop_codon:yes gene_type:complete
MSTCAVLFVKDPQPGKVKTRLQSHLSAEQAAGLYRAFVLDSAAVLQASGLMSKPWPMRRLTLNSRCATYWLRLEVLSLCRSLILTSAGAWSN